MKKFPVVVLCGLFSGCFAQTSEISLFGDYISPTGKTIKGDSVLYYLESFRYPEFPGGTVAWNKFLVSVFKYPENSRYKGMNEIVVVGFVVNSDGSLSDFKLTSGIKECPPCDEEAMRIARVMRAWTPGQEYGKNAKMNGQVAIPFKYLK